ncbi:hypothetical protein, partial [Bacillus pumilus]|uniref:hypothetical protein n=1 Tax=Bacillus pumilus TaxID=1408 RepID=UPI001C92DAFA
MIDMKKERVKKMRKVVFGGEGGCVGDVMSAVEGVGEGKVVDMYGACESRILTRYYGVNDIEEKGLS